ncbi:branched-chain amino acid aminotransferase [Paucilactobacillus oligofermentans DSM 15707 = LMG 22743]|uniref:Branched-chain-amino-acid aminotransferase n=1 Tax=Paucilactobacillus oligofermentans DSM 15707 = LMG 22743 TaxID=1423778 RepID=A0A0R1RM08_9LACO|nr:branched-chain amino acid aminotransferase [Paucilactobacillus oligofermentans]KRL57894.1 branched-chain amino acid aminotransferase [Paucilactobacillus oligofermentans DSM 15707 = LMG 22743]CUS26635.1 Putative branched-chain-amino-acid aminotransferase [Paucilactobacillus oligofermentans DSM 15707 = LMG 22743]
MAKVKATDIDFNNLGFNYFDLPYRFQAIWKDGKWSEGELTEDAEVHISEGSTVLHYGQSDFEGLKAYRTKDGSVQLFRPDRNAKRMQDSCARMMMPAYSIDKFIEAVKQVTKANEDFVPPYGTGGTLYLRPVMFGVGDNIGVHPADEYILRIFAMPVGAYFKGGMTPTSFVTSKYDRAAHQGTGQSKVGGNYAASLLPGNEAHQAGYSDVVYLDPIEHKKIEEAGAANFFGITKDGKKFITPKSPSILPSITKYSLLYLAEHRLGLQVEEGDIFIDQLDQFSEAGACGTAAVISPIGAIVDGDRKHVFYSETEVGPVTQKLYDTLTGIQFGEIEGPEGWIVKVD